MTDYSDAEYGVKGMFNIVSKELHYEGFVLVHISQCSNRTLTLN